MQILPRNNYFAPTKLSVKEVCFKQGSFVVSTQEKKVTVQKADLSPELRDISDEKLSELFDY